MGDEGLLSPLAMLRNYSSSLLRNGIPPTPALLRKQNGVPGMEPEEAACKARMCLTSLTISFKKVYYCMCVYVVVVIVVGATSHGV